MKEESRKLLDKAAHSIHASRVLVDNGEGMFAASPAYYAVFYVAEALLCEKGRHSALTAACTASLVSISRRQANFSRRPNLSLQQPITPRAC